MSLLATCEAMKPAAPVIRMFLGVYEEAIKFPGLSRNYQIESRSVIGINGSN